MPIEQAVRRPGVDLSSAEWIVLGDGQRWAFPGATIGVRPGGSRRRPRVPAARAGPGPDGGRRGEAMSDQPADRPAPQRPAEIPPAPAASIVPKRRRRLPVAFLKAIKRKKKG